MRINEIVGFFLVILGLVFGNFNKDLCSSWATGNIQCPLLFIFVGILLVVSGASLILLRSREEVFDRKVVEKK